MCKISVIIAVNNAEDYIAESIESVLNQSFKDFELIIIDYGSTDNTFSIIHSYSYKDKRIHLIENGSDYIQSLNLGLKLSKGKYIVRMNSDDLMHIDKLKLNHSTMEEFPEITVCSSWVTIIGERINRRIYDENISGLIQLPLIQMILNDTTFNVSSIIRKSFITEHHLFYKEYTHAEDYKLLAEIANLNGTFYMESQPLLYGRINDTKISRKQRLEKLQAISKIKKEILYSLCNKNEAYPALVSLCNAYFELAHQELVSEDEVYKILHSLFLNNKIKQIVTAKEFFDEAF
ncbi:glycosyltransferase [Bacteroidaceae bacterium HV4-6-C5C]|nr:glycosyltransferase [Bacteroidaceae bacterium HV4-6-C5C]